MSNLHSSKIIDIYQSPENYMPQHPVLHLESSEGLIDDTINLAKWIGNKISDRGDKAAKLLIKYKKCKDKEEEIKNEPDKKRWFAKSKEKKLKEAREKCSKIGRKLEKVWREVLDNREKYIKKGPPPVPFGLFYADLRKELMEEGVDESKVEDFIEMFKDVVSGG